MKRFLILFLFAASALAQHTPNINLNLPPFGTPNWDRLMNQNFTTLDNYLGGITQFPHNLKVPGLVAPGGSPTSCFHTDGSIGACGGVGVSQIIAGTNVTISPLGGTGVVTINATGGGGSGIAPWHRVGVVINPLYSDSTPQIQETGTLVDTAPELLPYLTQDRAYSFAVGWSPNEIECFGEGADDFSQPVRFPNCITGHQYSSFTKDPTNGKYLFSAVNTSTHVGDIYEATTLSALSQLGSPTFANVISCGGNGTETANTLGGVVPVWDSVHSLWRVLYTCQNSAGGAGGGFTTWLATGPTLNALTKFQTGTVCGFGSAASGPNIVECGTAQIFYSGTSLIGYFGTGPSGTVPTPFAYRVVDSTGIGNAFVADANPTITWQNQTEGLNYSQGQANGFVVSPSLSGTGTVMYWSGFAEQGAGATDCTIVAENPQPFSSIVNEVTSDSPEPVGLCGRYGVKDTWQGANAQAVTSRASDSGHSWQASWNNTSAYWTQTAQIATGGGGVVLPTNGSGAAYFSSWVPSSPNYTVSATCFISGTGGTDCGIIGRAVPNPVFTGYIALFVRGTGVQLFKYVNAVGTQIGSTYSGVTSGTHVIAITFSGPNLSVLVDGTSRITVADTAFPAAGVAGFFLTEGAGDTASLGTFTAN